MKLSDEDKKRIKESRRKQLGYGLRRQAKQEASTSGQTKKFVIRRPKEEQVSEGLVREEILREIGEYLEGVIKDYAKRGGKDEEQYAANLFQDMRERGAPESCLNHLINIYLTELPEKDAPPIEEDEQNWHQDF